MPALKEFYSIPPAQRDKLLLDAIREQHRWHYDRNQAYRRTVSVRGIGREAGREEIPGFLRASALTFKSYTEQLGTPFPQDEPLRFLSWLRDHLSIELPEDRFSRLRPRYPTLESLFRDVEHCFSDLGLEVVTSSGTSGKASIMIRDASSVRRATEAYFTAIDHYWGFSPRHNLVFVMPFETRVAMARIARMGTRELGLDDRESIQYTMPFRAGPDTIRIQSGRLFRTGLTGFWESRILNPLMNWASVTLAEKKYVRCTLKALRKAARKGGPVLLLGGLVQLDAVALNLGKQGGIKLPEGSRVATGGGMKQEYQRTPEQIRENLKGAIRSPDGSSVPVGDIYGMAEAHWAAFQCRNGNYHLPPWLYTAVLDDDEKRISGCDGTGLLAFWDPFAGGAVYPPFFQTADRVRLINGNGSFQPDRICPCGDDTPYIMAGSIMRVDLLEEAGCGATL